MGRSRTEISDIVELERAVAYLTKEGVSDDEVTARVMVARACFVAETNAAVFNCVIETTPVGLLFGFPYAGTLEEGERIDDMIAIAVTEHFEDSLGRHLSFITYPF